jgi:hypothetical protein
MWPPVQLVVFLAGSTRAPGALLHSAPPPLCAGVDTSVSWLDETLLWLYEGRAWVTTDRKWRLGMTGQWICDTCHEPIEREEDGWVEWLSRDDVGVDELGSGLRLVHHATASSRRGGCQYDARQVAEDRSTIMDVALPDLVGERGLALGLARIRDGVWPPAEGAQMIARVQRFELPSAH